MSWGTGKIWEHILGVHKWLNLPCGVVAMKGKGFKTLSHEVGGLWFEWEMDSVVWKWLGLAFPLWIGHMGIELTVGQAMGSFCGSHGLRKRIKFRLRLIGKEMREMRERRKEGRKQWCVGRERDSDLLIAIHFHAHLGVGVYLPWVPCKQKYYEASVPLHTFESCKALWKTKQEYAKAYLGVIL